MISGSASNTVIQAHTPRSVCVHVPGQPKPRPINRRNPLKADLVCMKMVRFHSHLLLIFLYVHISLRKVFLMLWILIGTTRKNYLVGTGLSFETFWCLPFDC